MEERRIGKWRFAEFRGVWSESKPLDFVSTSNHRFLVFK